MLAAYRMLMSACLEYYVDAMQPMDLGTVRQRLQQGKYASPRDTLEDTRLVSLENYRQALSIRSP